MVSRGGKSRRFRCTPRFVRETAFCVLALKRKAAQEMAAPSNPVRCLRESDWGHRLDPSRHRVHRVTQKSADRSKATGGVGKQRRGDAAGTDLELESSLRFVRRRKRMGTRKTSRRRTALPVRTPAALGSHPCVALSSAVGICECSPRAGGETRR